GDERQPAVEQALGVGEHPVEAADAQLVVLGAGAGDAADDAVAAGVEVGAADDGGRGPAAEGEGGELPAVVLAGRLRAGEPAQRRLLGAAGVLAVDDDGVVDLAG